MHCGRAREPVPGWSRQCHRWRISKSSVGAAPYTTLLSPPSESEGSRLTPSIGPTAWPGLSLSLSSVQLAKSFPKPLSLRLPSPTHQCLLVQPGSMPSLCVGIYFCTLHHVSLLPLVYPQQQVSKVSRSTSCNASSVCSTRVSLHLTIFSNCFLSPFILPKWPARFPRSTPWFSCSIFRRWRRHSLSCIQLVS